MLTVKDDWNWFDRQEIKDKNHLTVILLLQWFGRDFRWVTVSPRYENGQAESTATIAELFFQTWFEDLGLDHPLVNARSKPLWFKSGRQPARNSI